LKNALYLPAYEQGFLDENEELLAAFLAPGVPSGLVSAYCDNFRRAGIASLLQTGRSRIFRLRLQRSGRAYAHFLAHAPLAEQRTSHSFPLLDAVAAGDWATATEIAQRARHDWVQEDEYEEDFLCYEFLMQSQLLDASPAATAVLLRRWESCLEGSADLRLPVCAALQALDAAAFGEAIGEFMTERKRGYAREPDLHAPEVMATEASVSVEGVALIRMALRKGIAVTEQYPQVPSLALDDEPIVWRSDSFSDFS
jgi:hypothetical protein